MLSNITEFKSEILAGNRSFIARAITLIESQSENHRKLANELMQEILPFTGKSIRIGITGAPGVGKSTFIDTLGEELSKKNTKVAVLAVDPSSKISGGSILGDKTRMEKLISNKNVFIRPSPAGDELGGVAQKTYESILICEAAGFEIILVETVGVGQSEIAVKEMVDYLIFVTIAGAGDELQGIKRGIMEMIDLVIINKSDLIENSVMEKLKSRLSNALHLFPEKKSNMQVPILTCSSINYMGIFEVVEQINHYFQTIKSNGFFDDNRAQQKISWLNRSLEKLILDEVYQNKIIKKLIENYESKVLSNHLSAIEAAHLIFNEFRKTNEL